MSYQPALILNFCCDDESKDSSSV